MRQAGVIAIIAIIFIFVLSFILLGGGVMGGGMGPGHMRWWDHEWSGWGWGWGALMMLLWPAAIIAVVAGLAWLLAQAGSEREHAGGRFEEDEGPDRSLQILRERYARGEISKEEFDEMRHHLE